MNTQRAQEIVESPDMIHVTHNGTPIYIQNVNQESNTARVYPLNEPQNEKDVPLNQLVEH